MLMQTNSYIVPKDKRSEHARLMRRFRQTLSRLGCDEFEIYEQTGANWVSSDTNGRFVQIMRFRDRRHQLAVQAAERTDPQAQAIISEFCDLVNFQYQQQQGLFAVGFYTSVLPVSPPKSAANASVHRPEQLSADAMALADEDSVIPEVDDIPELHRDDGNSSHAVGVPLNGAGRNGNSGTAKGKPAQREALELPPLDEEEADIDGLSPADFEIPEPAEVSRPARRR